MQPRADHKLIAGIVKPGSQVLDLGCGSGELLALLVAAKQAKVQGVELDEGAIHDCVEKGLAVFHSDIDSGLTGYPDKTFDYVILNQSMQEIKKIDFVMDECLRVGRQVIVGFPNFAFFASRLQFLFTGKAPVTESLPHQWYDTPNVRFLSVRDFEAYCARKRITVLERHYLGLCPGACLAPNLFARTALFVITKEQGPAENVS